MYLNFLMHFTVPWQLDWFLRYICSKCGITQKFVIEKTMFKYLLLLKVVALAIMSKSNLNNFWWIGRVVGLIYVAAVL